MITQSKKIVILDQLSFPENFSFPDLGSHVVWKSYDHTNADQIVERLSGAHTVILSKVAITRATLQACPTLQHIAVGATGFDCVSVAACREHNVAVSHIPSYAATTIAEHVLACAVTLHRKILQHRQKVIDGEWQMANSFCLFGPSFDNLHGATLGIIGLGATGKKTAELAKAFGMNVIYCSRSEKDHWADRLTLTQLLNQADIVSVHCSLNDDTKNLIDVQELSSMRQGAILINTARGGIVNETAIKQALNSHHLGGIAFDVLAQEPPSNESPLLGIADQPNVIITPHSSWTSNQALTHVENTLSDNIRTFFTDMPQNIVSQ